MRDNILDRRFEGKAVRLRLVGVEEPIEGVVDEVSKYEIGVRTGDRALIIPKSTISYVVFQGVEARGSR